MLFEYVCYAKMSHFLFRYAWMSHLIITVRHNKKHPDNPLDAVFITNGREDRIRTCDPLVPSQVLYQAELLPDKWRALRDSNSRPFDS
jgi:hypothetical protein